MVYISLDHIQNAANYCSIWNIIKMEALPEELPSKWIHFDHRNDYINYISIKNNMDQNEEIISLLGDTYSWSFDDLPQEIIQKIISYAADSFNSTARVSSRFNQYTYELNFSTARHRIDEFSFPHYWVTDVIRSLTRIEAIEKILDGDRPAIYLAKSDSVKKTANNFSFSPLFWSKGKKYIHQYNWCESLVFSIARDHILFLSVVALLLLWILLLAFVHLPSSKLEIANLQYLTNGGEIAQRIDAQKVGCYTHTFTLAYSSRFDEFLLLSESLMVKGKMREIINQFANSTQEYLNLTVNINIKAREKWDPDTGSLQPYTVTYNFTTSPIDIEIRSYRGNDWWYCRDFIVHYVSVPCLLNLGLKMYHEKKVKIDGVVNIDITLLTIFILLILFIKFYSLGIYYKHDR